MKPIAIDIPLASPSLNEVLEWKHNRRLWWKYKSFRTTVSTYIRFVLAQKGALPKLPGGRCSVKMRVRFIRFSAGTLDDQNLRGGFKPTCDVLVKLGVLHDDSPTWLEDHYEQRKASRGDKRMRLEIEPAEAS
jgi:hypothetical protein